MIIIIKLSVNIKKKQTSDWSTAASTVLLLVTSPGLPREVSGETPKAIFDQKSLYGLCLGT